MELDYPTLKNDRLNKEINQLDKLGRSILLSLKQIPSTSAINKQLKSKLLKIISKDNVSELHCIVTQQVIRFDTTIGSNGSNWNMLHFCIKSDAIKCIEYILKKQFQQYQEQYIKLVNLRTVQGYTPLVIAIINKSNKALEKLLYYGGIDLHIPDEHKMSPYEIALNYKNDAAIRSLMSYQALTKKKQYLNQKALNQPISLPNHRKYFRNYMDALLCCLTLGMFQIQQNEQDFQKNGNKMSFVTINNQQIDYVRICSNRQINAYQIQWQKASQLLTGQRIPLYDSFNPFEIRQHNFTIKNHLIIFQCLSQQPWIIRKIIKSDRGNPNFYEVSTYPKRIFKKIKIDEHIPYLKQRKQAMFLSDNTELWPMLIQKALAKQHGAYFILNDFEPNEALEEVTGFPTIQIPIKSIVKNQLLSLLQKISAKNYLALLKGKKNSGLNQFEDSVDCFTILNYYEKGQKNLMLVNCPFISQKWKIKQKKQPLDLKLIKGHYNTHNQMCVWIDQSSAYQYFQSIIISMTFPNYERSQVKFKSTSTIFFKLRIQTTRIDQPTVFQLIDQNQNTICDLSSLQVMKNEGQQQIVASSPCDGIMSQIAEIQTKVGEYIFYIQLKDLSENVKKQYNLLCYSVDCLQPQFVEQQFAILEWLGYIKTYFNRIQQKCIVQSVKDFSIVLLKEKGVNKVKMQCQTTQQSLIQGKYIDESSIQLIKEGNIHYCVIKKIVSREKLLFDFE